MALTPAEIKAKIVERLVPKYRAALTWATLINSFQNSTAGQKAEFLAIAQGGAPRSIGQKLLQILQSELETVAAVEADSMMADGAFDLAEFDRVFGDG